MAPILDVLMQYYRICVPFTTILKYDHTYKILQSDVSFCKHISFTEELNREDNNVTFELLRMKNDEILIKLHDRL